MPTYNKLVRDKIPEINTKSGRRSTVRRLDDDEYEAELEKKLREEVAEYLQDKTVAELADIIEVVYALGRVHGVTPEALEEARKRKIEERGAFNERVFLVDVDDL